MVNLIEEIDNRAFNKINQDNTRKNHFIYPLYDTISSWIAYNIREWNIDISSICDKNKIKEKLIKIQKEEQYIIETWTWKSSQMKLKFASIFWKKYFNLKNDL